MYIQWIITIKNIYDIMILCKLNIILYIDNICVNVFWMKIEAERTPVH